VLCEDSTNIENINKLMNGDKAILCVTDPPYGVNYDPKWRERDLDIKAKGRKIIGDDNFDWINIFSFLPIDILYIWIASYNLAKVQFSIEHFGFDTKYIIIWNKDLAVLGRGNYNWKHEPCLYMIRKNCKSNWQGDKKQNTVWDIPTIHSFKNGKNNEEWGLVGHGNQKPIECMERPIRNNSIIDDIIVDPFLGSGSTLIACEKTDRICYGMEIDEYYTTVIVKRYVKFMLDNKKPLNIKLNGKKFNPAWETKKKR